MSKLFAVSLYFKKPWREGKSNLPEHMTINIFLATSWLEALDFAMMVHKDKGIHKWHVIAEIIDAPGNAQQQVQADSNKDQSKAIYDKQEGKE